MQLNWKALIFSFETLIRTNFSLLRYLVKKISWKVQEEGEEIGGGRGRERKERGRGGKWDEGWERERKEEQN